MVLTSAWVFEMPDSIWFFFAGELRDQGLALLEDAVQAVGRPAGGLARDLRLRRGVGVVLRELLQELHAVRQVGERRGSEQHADGRALRLVRRPRLRRQRVLRLRQVGLRLLHLRARLLERGLGLLEFGLRLVVLLDQQRHLLVQRVELGLGGLEVGLGGCREGEGALRQRRVPKTNATAVISRAVCLVFFPVTCRIRKRAA